MAKAENIEMTAEEAAKVFAELHKTGELSDEELDNVSGGCGDEIQWDNKYPTIPQMIEIIHELYRTVKDKQNNGEYYFAEYKGFRVTTSNKQIELSFEFRRQ